MARSREEIKAELDAIKREHIEKFGDPSERLKKYDMTNDEFAAFIKKMDKDSVELEKEWVRQADEAIRTGGSMGVLDVGLISDDSQNESNIVQYLREKGIVK